MLEIRYNKNTKELTGWWGDRFGNHEIKLKNRPDEAIVTLDTPIPDKPIEAWLYDEATESLIPNPDFMPPEPPRSTHISTIEAIDPSKARPCRIKRTWEGKDYFYDCLVSQSVKDQYLAGDVKVGDCVIVFCSDVGEQIVTAKVFKSWV